MSSETQAVGFYGKLPALGDFVGRRLPRDFVTPWDDWLQLSMASSRNQLGDAWLETYLTSPLWRFALAPGVCGEAAFAGVLMPSVDRVGRYFPLVLAVALPADASLMQVAAHAEWFAAAEGLLLSTLDDEVEFDLDAFDQRVEALGALPAAVPAERVVGGDMEPLRLRITDADDLQTSWLALAESLARRQIGSCSLWWTAGSEQVEPSLMLSNGLPDPACFAAMLDGVWDAGAAVAATVSAPVEPADAGAPLILDAGFPEEPA